MRLILKQYLSSLRERDELDAILPDLLSQMGMVVISTPKRGTKQNGVDIAAIITQPQGENKTYLFSIKAGDLNRPDWNGNSNQALRPSLDEIIDNYIFAKLSDEQRSGKIVICLCFGGAINENIIGDVNGYINKNTTANISYEIWNGDKLGQLIIDNLLSESLLPESIRKNLRKSLAMIEDPESSLMYFKSVIGELILEGKKRKGNTNKNLLTTIRQLSLCLWILHAWSRDLDNIESAYLASEHCILSCWELIKKMKKSSERDKIEDVFEKIRNQYFTLNEEYLIKKISPLSEIRNGISSGIYPPCKFATNFKIYDIIGRYAMYGIWLVWKSRIEYENSDNIDEENIKRISHLQRTLINIIINNPSAHLPFKDDNSIELALACFFLMLDDKYTELTKSWIAAIIERADFTLKVERNYSRTLFKYAEFLEQPNNDEYKNEVTKASVLYALLAYLSALLNAPESYQSLQNIKNNYLSHSNLQIWFPSKSSEDFYYNGNDNHGVVFSNVPLDKSPVSFLIAMNNEAKMTEGYYQLSAIKDGILPIIFLASRVNRYPIPLMAFGEEFSEEIDECTK